MSGTENFVDYVVNAIQEAHQDGQIASTKNDVLDGFSGESVVGCLQRFTRYFSGRDDVCYLEIGIFQGLTLLSTSLANPDIACFGVDNFFLFNDGQENHKIVLDRQNRLGVKNAHILNMDFEEALDNLDSHLGGKKIGVLFVDGAHDYRSQLVALLKARHHLADDCVIIVDDANYAHVRQSTADFLAAQPDYALLFEAYTPAHPANMTPEVKTASLRGWWNGINIMVRDPEHRLGRALPAAGSREKYFDSHDVFRHEFADLAIDALRYCTTLLDGDEADEQKARGALQTRLSEYRAQHPDRFKHQNTESAGLSDFTLHTK